MVVPPTFTGLRTWLPIGAAIAIGAGFQIDDYNSNKGCGTITDCYHNVVIAPLLTFLIGIVLPIIWTDGKVYEQITAIVVICAYFALVFYDVRTERVNMTKWVAKYLPAKLETWRKKYDPSYRD